MSRMNEYMEMKLSKERNFLHIMFSCFVKLFGSYVKPVSYSKASLLMVSLIGRGRCKGAPFRLGISFLRGLSIPLLRSTSQSILLKNGCERISSQPGRFSGSLRRHFLIRSCASSVKSCEKTGLFSRIFVIIFGQFLFGSVKGGLPLIIS